MSCLWPLYAPLYMGGGYGACTRNVCGPCMPPYAPCVTPMPHLSPHHTPLRLPYAFTVPSLVTFLAPRLWLTLLPCLCLACGPGMPLTLVCPPCGPGMPLTLVCPPCGPGMPLTLVCHPCTPPVSPHTHPDLHCFMPSTVTALTNPPVAMNTCLGPACLPCTHVWALHACHGA